MSFFSNVSSNKVKQIESSLADIAYNVKEQGGAKGDGVTDDTTAIQNALTNHKKIYFPNGTYKISSKLTVDITKNTLLFDRVTIDTTAISTGEAIYITASDFNTPKNIDVISGGLHLIGNGLNAVGTIGLKIDAPTNYAVNDLMIRHVKVTGYETDFVYGSNVYNITFDECVFDQATNALHAPNGISNAGERISFKNCTFANSTNILLHENPYGEMRFENCSFDYFTNRCMTITAGYVKVSQSHFEASSDNDYWFYLSGAVSGCQDLSLSMKQVDFIIQGTRTKMLGYIDASCLWGGLKIEDFYLQNANTAMPTLIDGTGYAVASRMSTHPNYQKPPISRYMNLLSDGGFNSGFGEWSSIGAVAPTLDNSTFYEGTKSLKFAVTTNGQACTISKDITMLPGQKIHLSFQYKLNLTSNNFFGSLTFYDSLGNSLPGSYTFLNTNTSTSGWKLLCLTGIAPKGTVKANLNFNTGAWQTSNSAWLDDVIINVTN
jgi:hypothetical protein